jgi:hypothetical protein
MNPQDLVALVTAVLLSTDPVVANGEGKGRAAAERRALASARRIVARTHELAVADVPGGPPSRGVAVEDDTIEEDA